MYNDTVNHMLETKAQKDEINNKLNVQMKEQFAKIYELINEEEQTSNNSQIERIKSIQNLIRNLLKNMKNEKIKL
jgi:pantothenate kinase-related protein Tda10